MMLNILGYIVALFYAILITSNLLGVTPEVPILLWNIPNAIVILTVLGLMLR